MQHASKEQIQTLQRLIDASERIVFFGGAGVSTESGIPDFRSANGIFREQRRIPPEEIVSREFFDAHPKEFYDFYREKLVYPDAKPNPAHLALAKLEQAGKLTAVVTQNIDGLHQKAGSRRVFELHGSTLRNHCMRCGKAFGLQTVTETDGVPRCSCGGIIKPDVVLYGEPLDDAVVSSALSEIERADLLIVAGTSLRVYPAAGLVRWFRGERLVVINYDETELDASAALHLRLPVGEVLGSLQIEA